MPTQLDSLQPAHPAEELPPPPNRTRPRRPGWLRALALCGLSLVVAVGVYSYAEYRSLSSSIFVQGGGTSNDLLTYSPDKQGGLDASKFQHPGDGRFNLLVLGIGGVNDEGQAHDGTLLTDSIQLLSIDTINHKASLTSVPRDLYVTIPGHGPNKINAVYEFGEMDHPGGGGLAAREAFGKLLGVSISNFVIIDFTAAKDVVNTVGGIDVDVPKALYDPAYPCDDEINYCPFTISAGPHHMDGDLALKYMRTRHADSDFGRSARQQLVMAAVKKKALSLGILSNPAKVASLIDTLGRHVKTDLQPSEVQSLVSIMRDIPSQDIGNNVLDTSEKLGLLTAGSNPYAGYVEYPVGGYTAYGPIQQWFQKNNPDPLLAKEGASLAVANLSGSNKQFDAFVSKLQDYGFSVKVVTAPSSSPSLSQASGPLVYATGSSKPITGNYLHSLLGSDLSHGSPLSSGADFEVLYQP